MRLPSALLLSLFLSGCVGLGSRESSVMLPDGKVYKVRCQSDGRVNYDDGYVKIAVDNTGPAGSVLPAVTSAIGVYGRLKAD